MRRRSSVGSLVVRRDERNLADADGAAVLAFATFPAADLTDWTRNNGSTVGTAENHAARVRRVSAAVADVGSEFAAARRCTHGHGENKDAHGFTLSVRGGVAPR